MRALRPTDAAARHFWQQLRPPWLAGYRSTDLPDDVIAGLIVAIMLVPQAMAYALLAGLPAQVGLYASIAPLLLYGLLGSSRTLAVGPVAIVSLLTATGIGALGLSDPAAYARAALALALLVGLLQIGMGALRAGFLVNFLSHPVLSGFTTAAALVIGFSQVRHLLGVRGTADEAFFAQVVAIVRQLGQTNGVTLLIGALSVAALRFGQRQLPALLQARYGARRWILPLTRSTPLAVVLLATLAVRLGQLDARAGVAIVGAVPAGLPSLTWPTIDLPLWRALLPTALAITLVGYMESVSVAKALAARKREKISANRELLALGAANVGAALTGGYPVTGGFSRSFVNDTAGARSGVASIVTAALVALSTLLLTPLFYAIPRAVLAAIIVVAVAALIDTRTLRRAWRYNRQDAAALLITFGAVLALGVENGILIGAATSLVLFLARTSNPHVAIVGRLGDSQIYRNILRHPVQTWPEVALVRIDASLYFGNTAHLEETVLGLLAAQPALRYIVLIGTAINEIDYSALEALELLHHETAAAGVELHLAAIKGPVMDRLLRSGLLEVLGPGRVHFTTHAALRALGFVH